MKRKHSKTYVESFAVKVANPRNPKRWLWETVAEMYVVKMNFASSFPPFVRLSTFKYSLN